MYVVLFDDTSPENQPPVLEVSSVTVTEGSYLQSEGSHTLHVQVGSQVTIHFTASDPDGQTPQIMFVAKTPSATTKTILTNSTWIWQPINMLQVHFRYISILDN